MIYQIFQDALFSAIAAIGFSAISNPPVRAYIYCALIAAAGHSLRFWMMDPESGCGIHIVPATLAASFMIGLLSVFLSPKAAMPAETCIFPSLLPMVPGIYAYKAFGGFVMGVISNDQADCGYYLYQSAYNGSVCLCILLCMAVGATLPIFMFEKVAFQATRHQ